MSPDVLIAGGGPAGSFAAAHLANSGFSVCIIDPMPKHGTKLAETLYPRAERTLRNHNIAIPPMRSACVTFMHGKSETQMTLKLDGSIGVLDRNQLDQRLQDNAREAGARFAVERVKKIEVTEHGVTAFTGNSRLHAAYCIDATGKNPISLKPGEERGSALPLDMRTSFFTHYETENSYGHVGPTIIGIERGFVYVLPINQKRICIGITQYVSSTGNSHGNSFEKTIDEIPFLRSVTGIGKPVLPVIPVKNAETRIDPVSDGRVFRVGDTLGFRDPFGWDGISYALETSHLAARFLILALGDQSPDQNDYRETVRRLGFQIRTESGNVCDHFTTLFSPLFTLDPHIPPQLLGILHSLNRTSRGDNLRAFASRNGGLLCA